MHPNESSNSRPLDSRLGGDRSLLSRATVAWLPWLAPLLGLAVSFAPMFASGFDAVPGDLEDPRLILFTLEHSYGFVSDREADAALWSPPAFHPVPRVAGYTDLLLSSAVLYWPLRALGADIHLAFQLWMILALVFNYLGFYFFLSSGLRLPSAASAVGAYLFAFAASRMADVYHPQMVFDVFYALAFLAAACSLREETTPRGRYLWIAVFFAAVVLQLYHGYYNFFFLYFFLGVASVRALTIPSLRRRLLDFGREHGPYVALVAALALLAMSPAVELYLGVKEIVGGRHPEVVEYYAPRFHTWVLPNAGNTLYGWIHQATGGLTGDAHKWGLGLGIVTPILALWGLRENRRRPVVRIAAATAGVSIFLATYFPVWGTAWSELSPLIYGAEGIRALHRIGFGLQVLLGIGVAFAVARLLPRRPSLAWVILVVVAAEQSQQLPAYSAEASQRRIADVAAAVDRPSCPAFVITVAGGVSPTGVVEDAMLAAQVTGAPTLNGRSGQWPPGYGLQTIVGARRRLEPELDAWVADTCVEELCWLELTPEGVKEVARLPGPCASGRDARLVGASPGKSQEAVP